MDTQRLLRLFGICFTACLLTTAQGFHIETPDSVTAVEGSCVLVPCQTRPHIRVMWYKLLSFGWPVIYDGTNPDDVIDEFKGRTTMLGHPSEGNCTLRINNVKMSDDITLFPYINPESDRYYKPIVQIKTEPRTSPKMSGPESPVKEGEVFSLSCSVQHSCPPSPPAIEWMNLTVGTPEVFTDLTPAGISLTVSTVTVTAARSQHGKMVHCLSTFPDMLSIKSKPFTLDIAFLSIMVPNTSCSEREGMLKCACWVDAYPVATVKWMLIDRTELPASVFPNVAVEGTLTSSEVELVGDLAKQGVICVANNSHSTETHQIPRAESTAFLPWIILGCITGLLGCICGCIYICYLQRRRSKFGVNSHNMVKDPGQNGRTEAKQIRLKRVDVL